MNNLRINYRVEDKKILRFDMIKNWDNQNRG
jgi:hypothetical protein